MNNDDKEAMHRRGLTDFIALLVSAITGKPIQPIDEFVEPEDIFKETENETSNRS